MFGVSVRIHQWRAGPMQNFVYVIEDGSGAAAIVDPAFEMPRVLRDLDALGSKVTHIVATHGHHDHVDGIPAAKAHTRALVVAHESADHPLVDVRVKDGERFMIGRVPVDVVHTPGHRFDSTCYVLGGTHLLTGDTLFVGECGRVDLPGSDPRAMHDSLLRKLAALPGELIVLPGHDYGATPTSTLARERAENYTLKPRTLEEFLRFMVE